MKIGTINRENALKKCVSSCEWFVLKLKKKLSEIFGMEYVRSFVDQTIDKYKIDERDLARQHVARLKELGLQGSLLLFDRWYPSAEFIAHLVEEGF